jgi:hypothetical protein
MAAQWNTGGWRQTPVAPTRGSKGGGSDETVGDAGRGRVQPREERPGRADGETRRGGGRVTQCDGGTATRTGGEARW